MEGNLIQAKIQETMSVRAQLVSIFRLMSKLPVSKNTSTLKR